ncbi:MAG: DUF4148 domain-containing protein [Sphingomonas sp.]|uniref:hypothetical protein n=1 Tax=Sphingomonas sp. TaxID=28214 RepID=UPI001ACCF862|nr:hypothetical protein [Sphingomonas sp.]MBN8807267.1 DUF4148 domain-containing protein [Sphingomonas sp.]
MKTFLIAAGLAVGLASAAVPTVASAAPAPQRDWHHDNGRHNGWHNDRHRGWDHGRRYGWDRGRHYGWHRGWRGHGYRSRCHWEWRHHRQVRVCYR